MGMDDPFEDYFEKQMMRDIQGVEEYEQQVDYFEKLKEVEERVAAQGHLQPAASQRNFADEEEGLEDEYLMQNIIGQVDEEVKDGGVGGYVGEY